MYPDANLAVVTSAEEINAIADYLNEELYASKQSLHY